MEVSYPQGIHFFYSRNEAELSVACGARGPFNIQRRVGDVLTYVAGMLRSIRVRRPRKTPPAPDETHQYDVVHVERTCADVLHALIFSCWR